MVLNLAMSQVNDYSFLLFLFGVLRICHYREIKFYKITIKIKNISSYFLESIAKVFKLF